MALCCVEQIQEMAGDVDDWKRVAGLDPSGFILKSTLQVDQDE